MRIMSRYLFVSFLSAYVICFSALVGLYIIIDLFSNADEFLEDHSGTLVFLRRVGKFYFIHTFEYFDRLSPIITQVAAMTALSGLHKHNEIVPLLAAGVPTRRILMPILGGVVLVIGLGVANSELVLPRFSFRLQLLHENIEADREIFPSTQRDADGVLLRARFAHPKGQRLEHVNVTLPTRAVGRLVEIYAPRARRGADPVSGREGWLLENPDPSEFAVLKGRDKIRRTARGDLWVFTEVGFGDMVRSRHWLDYAGTADLVGRLHDSRIHDPQSVRILIHQRLMQPVLNLLLVLIGIPWVLQWERKNVYRSIIVSMALSALFFIAVSLSSYFATFGHVDPMTAAWLPVFVFAPIALVTFHNMGT